MNALNRLQDPFYCIMRFIVGLMFACHGLDKIFRHARRQTEALPPLMMLEWLGRDRLVDFSSRLVC